MSRMDGAAELRKLAHTLDVDTERLAMLEPVPAADLRALRTQVAEALFQADKHHFTRMATLSKAVPGAVSAKLTELTVPPLLAARTAELLDPHRAADLVQRISDRYLADVSARMDASRAPALVAAIPPNRVATIGAELARRGEWVVMGGFVAHVSEDALRAAVSVLTGEQLLRTGFVLDDMSRLDLIGTMLTDAQLDDMLRSAAAKGLWDELAEMIGNVAPQRVARFADRFAKFDEATRAKFRAAVDEGHLAPGVLDSLDRRGGG